MRQHGGGGSKLPDQSDVHSDTAWSAHWSGHDHRQRAGFSAARELVGYGQVRNEQRRDPKDSAVVFYRHSWLPTIGIYYRTSNALCARPSGRGRYFSFFNARAQYARAVNQGGM